MNQPEDERQCLECGRPVFGRIDKKFCSDACRNSYNNKHNADSNNYVRNVNNVLRKNRRVLIELNPNGKTKLKMDKLIQKGFSTEFVTNTYKTKTGQEYRYCYDQGYLVLDDGYVLLVEKKDY